MKKIAIIGGGYTGLVSAGDLACNPEFEIHLFERSTSLGGLAGDFTLQGESLEKTYHHLFRSDTDILQMIEELGLGDRLEWRDSSVAILYNGRAYPFMSPMDVLRFSPIPFLSRLRLGFVMLYLKTLKNWTPLVDKTALQWMRQACGEAATRVIWQPLLRGKFAQLFDRVSMAWLWARIHIRANSRQAGSREKLGYIRGGFSLFTAALECRFRMAKGQVHLGATITHLAPAPGGGILLKVSDSEIHFDAVVFTGSCQALARLVERVPQIDQAYLRQLRSIPYLGAICLIFATDQDLGEQYWLNINEGDAPFLVFINHTKFIPRERYNGKYVYYIGSYQAMDGALFNTDEAAIKLKWYDYLKTIYPKFRRENIVEEYLFKLRDAQHVVELGYPKIRPSYQTPIKGLYLANFAQIFPEDRGTNYAVREGRKISSLVAREA
jgi:protoporphyrinogen oxidase